MEKRDITSYASEYLKAKDDLKILRDELRGLKEDHDDYDELVELTKKVKELKEKIEGNDEIEKLKEKIKDQKERADLVAVVLAQMIMEEQLTLFEGQNVLGLTYEDKVFKLVEKLKVEKQKA